MAEIITEIKVKLSASPNATWKPTPKPTHMKSVGNEQYVRLRSSGYKLVRAVTAAVGFGGEIAKKRYPTLCHTRGFIELIAARNRAQATSMLEGESVDEAPQLFGLSKDTPKIKAEKPGQCCVGRAPKYSG